MPEYTLAAFKLLWMCSCYFNNMQTRANFMKSSLLLTKCLHHRQFSEAFLIWECQIKICFGCLFPYLFSLSLHKLLKKLPEQCLNFQLPYDQPRFSFLNRYGCYKVNFNDQNNFASTNTDIWPGFQPDDHLSQNDYFSLQRTNEVV